MNPLPSVHLLSRHPGSHNYSPSFILLEEAAHIIHYFRESLRLYTLKIIGSYSTELRIHTLTENSNSPLTYTLFSIVLHPWILQLYLHFCFSPGWVLLEKVLQWAVVGGTAAQCWDGGAWPEMHPVKQTCVLEACERSVYSQICSLLAHPGSTEHLLLMSRGCFKVFRHLYPWDPSRRG